MAKQGEHGIAWTEQLKKRFWSYVDIRDKDECSILVNHRLGIL
jgi:hypothetical protein